MRRWAMGIALASMLSAGAGVAAAAKTTITLAVYGSPEFYQALLDSFNAANPDIEAKLQVIPGFNAYVEKMPLLVASGQAPDLGILSPRIFSDWVPKGVLQPLDPFIKVSGFDESAFFPASLDESRYTEGARTIGYGALYAIPIDYQSQSMFIYNVGAFTEAGLAEPDDSWSWDTLHQDAPKLIKLDAGGQVQRCAINDVGGLLPWAIPFIWSAGGQFIDPSYTHMDVAQPEAMRAWQWLYDFHNETNFTCGGSFLAEKQAMYIVGQYAIHYYQWHTKAKFAWDVAPYPKDPDTGQRKIAGASDALGLFASSKNPQAAWRLLQFIGSDELQAWMAKTYLRPVANRRAAAQALYLATATGVPGGLPLHYSRLAGELGNVGEKHVGLGYQDIMTMAGKVWGDVLAGKLSLSQGVSRIQQQGDVLLKSAGTAGP